MDSTNTRHALPDGHDAPDTGLQESVQRVTPGMGMPPASLSRRMQRAPAPLQSASVAQKRSQAAAVVPTPRPMQALPAVHPRPAVPQVAPVAPVPAAAQTRVEPDSVQP